MQRESGWQVRACITEGIHPENHEKMTKNDHVVAALRQTPQLISESSLTIFWQSRWSSENPKPPVDTQIFDSIMGLQIVG